MDSADVTARLSDLIAQAPGRVSLAVRSRDGFRFDHDSTRVVPAASTIKVPILFAYFAAGMPWDLPVALPATRVGGCGPLSLLPSVTSLPAGEVLRLMIALSDNDATNALIGIVGVGEVSRLLGRAGTRHTVLRRRMMDPAAAAAGHENETCAADLAELLGALRAGVLLPPRESAMALAVMREQQFDEGLPAYLPQDVRCASKTGSLPGVRHDIAVLERGDAWVSVAALATDLMDGPIDRGTSVFPTWAAIGEAVAGLLP